MSFSINTSFKELQPSTSANYFQNKSFLKITLHNFYIEFNFFITYNIIDKNFSQCKLPETSYVSLKIFNMNSMLITTVIFEVLSR